MKKKFLRSPKPSSRSSLGAGVYLDYAATTPLKPEVLRAIASFIKNNFGNPSSIHQFGQIARKSLDEARSNVADFLGCHVSEIIFTSGATESINLAILGLVHNFGVSKAKKPHIITSTIEHHATLHTCQYLEKEKLAEVTYLKPNKEGIVELKDVKKAIKQNTLLVSIMYVNNEIGTIQPIREIGKIIEKENKVRSTKYQENSKIYFHTDAVQAINYLNCKVDYLHIDLLSFSGHKIGAPKGIGVLYFKKGTPLKPILHGGSQEFSLRPGTENISGIVGIAKAVEILNQEKLENRFKKIQKLRDYFIAKLRKEIPDILLNGSKDDRIPSNANIYFKYIEGESIVLSLDLEGIAASTGSACTSASLEPSHVIMATYQDAARAAGSVRFTIGEKTNQTEIDYTINKLKIIAKRLRSISPYNKENPMEGAK